MPNMKKNPEETMAKIGQLKLTENDEKYLKTLQESNKDLAQEIKDLCDEDAMKKRQENILSKLRKEDKKILKKSFNKLFDNAKKFL
jgi:hypothetical protein